MKAIINGARKDPVYFALDGKELPINLSLAAISEIQEKYGDIGSAMERAALEKEGIGVLIDIVTILLNDAVETHNEEHPQEPAWELYTLRQISRRFGMQDIPILRKLLMAAMTGSLPDANVQGEVTDELQALLDDADVPEPEEKN